MGTSEKDRQPPLQGHRGCLKKKKTLECLLTLYAALPCIPDMPSGKKDESKINQYIQYIDVIAINVLDYYPVKPRESGTPSSRNISL